MIREAILYERENESTVQCRLCAHRCVIRSGKRGLCGVRENREGTLYTLVYGSLVARSIDPIEKKPLFHFQPGSLSYSIATAGCNMSCSHCQNYQISREAAKMSPIPGTEATPREIADAALQAGCRSISYTYTEPTIFMEFAMDCASEGAQRGLANVFVTNGFMSEEAADLATLTIDAANVDLKAATDEHYRKICGASLQPVLDTIEKLHSGGVWVEVTTLVIPGLNDDDESLRFIASFLSGLGREIPWHLSRFFPTYQMNDVPPTPMETLTRAEEIGREKGLLYVYLGNVSRGEDATRCPACGQILVRRTGYGVKDLAVSREGRCEKCGRGFDGRV